MQIKKINDILESFHDAILVSIEDNIHENISKLTFISSDEKTIMSITLHGVADTRCVDWKIGNIVLDILVLDIDNPISRKRVFDLIVYVQELSESQIENKKYLSVLNAIESSELYILEINPSYGAYFVGIVEDITIEPSENNPQNGKIS